jgi:hypothetical protein
MIDEQAHRVTRVELDGRAAHPHCDCRVDRQIVGLFPRLLADLDRESGSAGACEDEFSGRLELIGSDS